MHLMAKQHARFSLRWTIIASVVVAMLAAVFSIYQVSGFPPHLQKRALIIGAASTTMLIDEPQSEATNLSATADQFGSLQARTVLIANLMTTDPVLAYIGRLAGLPPSAIDADAPITANVPQAFIEPGSGAAASDILASADHYKLQMQVDPTVPILHIYTQAPSADAAIRLASASVAGLREYLSHLGGGQGISPAARLRLEQLGTPHGGTVNSGAPKEIALLTFVTIFALAYCVAYALSRVRLGWRSAGQSLTMPQ
jgi:hypothetical protein